MEPSMILTLAGGLLVLGGAVTVVLIKKRTAYLGPVKEELQKEKGWLRRGEYNAAMVKGRQNLELLLKLVAEKNGIQLDNTAQAVANAREEEERRNQGGRKQQYGHDKTKKVMTHHQFNRWLSENGYLDRVARWEMNQVRLIGNKAVHENYGDKDAAWNQYNYLEDILKTITEHSQNPKKHHEHAYVETDPKEKTKTNLKPNPKNNRKEVSDADVSTDAELKKKRRRRRRKPQGAMKTEQEKGMSAPTNVNVVEAAETKKSNRRRRKPQSQAKAEKSVKTESKPKSQKPRKQQNQPKQPNQSKQQNQPKPKNQEKAQSQAKPQSRTKPQSQTKPQNQPKPTEQAAAKKTGEQKTNHHRRRKPHAKQNKEAAGSTVKTEKKNEEH